MTSDVVVIGGGVVGLATARALAREGAHVTVVERGSPAREASWAAAGMLSPLGEAGHVGDLRVLAEASLDRWPRFAERIQAEAGLDIGYRATGALRVAYDAAAAAALRSLFEQAGPRAGAELLDAAGARQLEPALTDDVVAGLSIARDHVVDNRALGEALQTAAHAAGVQIRSGAAVDEIIIGHAAGGKRRFTSVRLTNGDSLTGGTAILAAGAWSAALRGLPRTVPVRPVRGQMYAVADGGIARTLVAPGCYLVPRDDGRLLVGATVEDAGFAPGPTAAGLGALFAAAARAVPTLATRPIVEIWAGYRPGSPDDLPILGPDPDVAGFHYATGHYRNGILMTPITAESLAAAITGNPPPVPLDAFSIARFAP